VPGCHHGALGDQGMRHRGPVIQGRCRQRGRDGGQAGAVTQQQMHREVGLPGLGERRPVGGDRGLQVEQAAVDQAMGADRGQALGRRGDVDDGVAGPGAGPGGLGMTAHKSTTSRFSRVTATAAPTSPCAAKFSANASRTGRSLGSQRPAMATLTTRPLVYLAAVACTSATN
jgi:hypothetical protein